jgi:hypothetical protein
MAIQVIKPVHGMFSLEILCDVVNNRNANICRPSRDSDFYTASTQDYVLGYDIPPHRLDSRELQGRRNPDLVVVEVLAGEDKRGFSHRRNAVRPAVQPTASRT